MVIHGAIDGYSRLIVYLKCCNNNLAETVLDLFLKAVQACGCPLRVRGDRGVENTQVADYMINQGGSCRNRFICGQSVHNQRIERLWRDLYTGCTVIYYRLFYYMEDIKILDPDSHLDLFCLQFVFIPRINAIFNSSQQHGIIILYTQHPINLHISFGYLANTQNHLPV